MDRFIITTTDTIPNAEITEILDIVYSNIVIGTNIFSDIAAAFTDFLGGKSRTYISKLDAMREEAKNELICKARQLGANAIIGVRTDYEEISGGSKQMFMVYMSGTACIVRYNENQP